ncbi:MAG: PrsW family intramembrane metalloprotease, partial [Candidatus Dormiibacterota bacterium]
MQPPSQVSAQARAEAAPATRHRWRWLFVLLIGLGLWIVSVVVTALTRNTNLIPADILVGSFLVPVSAVVWNFDHEADSYLPMTRIFFAFVVGGLLGVLLAAVLEALLVGANAFQYIVVGLIEEFVKLLALFVVAQRLPRYTTRDGIVLGATVGFGFAALESSGYAFNSLITTQGLSLNGLVFSVVARGILAPLGHGLWTAVLGGFLFHASERRNRLRPSWALLGMFFAVAALHALWDSSGGIATIAVGVLSGVSNASAMTAGEQVVATVVGYGLMLLIGAIGVGVLLATWLGLVRRPRGLAAAAAPTAVP